MTGAITMDEHVHRAITAGLRLRGEDVVTAQEDERRKTDDDLLLDRGQDVVLEVLIGGERIESYSGARPFPSALFLGYRGNKPYHVVAAFDAAQARVYVITAYEPSLAVFESDYRTRRK